MGPTCSAKKLVVSLHDVAPPFEGVIRDQVGELNALGIHRYALKVVPNWHGRFPLAGYPSFVRFIREQIDAGAEIVLHGFEHRPNGPVRGHGLQRLRASLFAPNTAEFLTLLPDEAREAACRGIEDFRRLDLSETNLFCPPGWLISADNARALRGAGMRYVIGMFGVRDLETRRWQWVPSLGYMGSSTGQECGVGLLNGIARATLVPRAPAVKVYLHPQGDQQGRAFRRILETLRVLMASGDWRPSTFGEILGA